MNTQEAFLADIIANPGDDALRLIYADWLEEQGGEPQRAAFIRYQLGLWDRFVDDEPYADVVWNDSMTSLTESGGQGGPRQFGWDWRWTRGFISWVCCPCSEWLKHGPALCRNHPLEEVQLSDKEARYVEPDGWTWYYADSSYGNHSGDPNCIPGKIWRRMGENPYHWFRSREDATNSLSQGCIRWARESEHERAS
jgi:uncharacterized protein (TIGR02996 family)